MQSRYLIFISKNATIFGDQQKRKHMQKVVFSPKDRYYGIFVVNFLTDLFFLLSDSRPRRLRRRCVPISLKTAAGVEAVAAFGP